MTADAAVPAPPTAPVRWRRSRIGALTAMVVIFLAYSVPPYLTLDPTRSRIAPPAAHPWYYPLLASHVVFGAIAMVTCLPQIWPWFRRRHPDAHRRIGRVYVFAGVVPAALLGFTIGTISPFGPVIRVSNMLLATLWLAFTVTGFRRARQRRYADHRRWMIRSVTLTLSIITNRVWAVIAAIVLVPQLPTMFGGNERMMVQAIAGLAGWLGWTLPLLAAEWWLDREGLRSGRQLAGPNLTTGRRDVLAS